ncbi:hypothetical protein FAVG1_11947 [Fusarium avenaceum]|nr:hypothetical protein FAVG1_11947 [Fusarium avenaceum]
MILFLVSLLAIALLVSAECECGYEIGNNEGDGFSLFMDRLETDFGQLHDLSQSHDWVAQQFTVSAKDGRGNYSKAFTPANVYIPGGESQDQSDHGDGLQLRVSSDIGEDNKVPASEVDTARLDLHWGSFRAGMKLTETKGTCSAFFWYFNDTQEIDIEFLSREFDYDKGAYPVNLVVQSKQSLEAGYDANTFHEYRFDYLPGQVLFYADSKLLAQMEGDDMPSTGGHLILQHWSNGNPLWSGGPPMEDAVVTVSYVKAYFNSSNNQRQSFLSQKCHEFSEASVCLIRDVTNPTSPGKSSNGSNLPSQDPDDESNGAFIIMPTEPFLDIILINHTNSESLFAHVTGRDEQGVVILLADGETIHRPQSPSEILQPVGADIAIPIGGPEAQKKVRIPHIFGGRIWFCKGKPLTFLLNPGPAVVEPSVTNPTDPNFDADWGFCEFTYNNDQLYVNVSYVDFVSLPIGLELENEAGKVTRVPGMPKNGLDQVCDGLKRQGEKDGAGWEKLVVKSKSGSNLRALSVNGGAELHPGLLENHFVAEIDAAWKRYEKEDIEINTQAEWGDVKGRVHHGKLVFKDVGKDKLKFHFEKPSTRDVVSCSTGPFAGGPDVTPAQLNIGARIAAALNRTTLSSNPRQPEGESVDAYYGKGDVNTNHYSRICHEVTIEGKGYAFPYDDVGAAGGVDQSGFLNDGRPKVLTVHVGGQEQ